MVAATTYVVLAQSFDDEAGVWTVRALEVEAHSAQQAIRIAAKETGGGRWVAVPARSWQPVSVKVETQTRMVLS